MGNEDIAQKYEKKKIRNGRGSEESFTSSEGIHSPDDDSQSFVLVTRAPRIIYNEDPWHAGLSLEELGR